MADTVAELGDEYETSNLIVDGERLTLALDTGSDTATPSSPILYDSSGLQIATWDQSSSEWLPGDFAPTGLLMGALRGTKQVVSDLITRLPDFWFRQILRDSVSAWTLSGANYTPVISSLKETNSSAICAVLIEGPNEIVGIFE